MELQEESHRLNAELESARARIALLSVSVERAASRRDEVVERLRQLDGTGQFDADVEDAVRQWAPRVREEAALLGKPEPHAWQVRATAVAASGVRPHVAVIAAAGAGKSLTYQMLVGLLDKGGLVLVIEPLLALAQEQCDALNRAAGAALILVDGKPRPTAIVLGGLDEGDFHERIGRPPADLAARRRATLTGTPAELTEPIHPHSTEETLLHWLQLEVAATMRRAPLVLFISPEKAMCSLQLHALLREAARLPCGFPHMVLDECHCVASHGHEFRPDYLLLGEIRAAFPALRLFLLTATASPASLYSISTLLGCESLHVERLPTGSLRANMRYRMLPVCGAARRLGVLVGLLLERPDDIVIVYCTSRATCELVAGKVRDALPARARRIDYYHAGLTAVQRASRRLRWCIGELTIMVATIAWGMGLDKADVRRVIHWTIPRSIEAWYQEASRAGRDGLLAENVVLYELAEWVHSAQLRSGSVALSQKGREYGLAQSMAVLRMLLNPSTCRHSLFESALGDGSADAACRCHREHDNDSAPLCQVCSEGAVSLIVVARDTWLPAFLDLAANLVGRTARKRLQSSEGSITLLSFYNAWTTARVAGCSLPVWQRRALFAWTLLVDGAWTMTMRLNLHSGDGSTAASFEPGGRRAAVGRWIMDARLDGRGRECLLNAPELVEVRLRSSALDPSHESLRLEMLALAHAAEASALQACEVHGKVHGGEASDADESSESGADEGGDDEESLDEAHTSEGQSDVESDIEL